MRKAIIAAAVLAVGVLLSSCSDATVPGSAVGAVEDLTAEELERYRVAAEPVVLALGATHVFPDEVSVEVTASPWTGGYDGPFVYNGEPLMQVQTSVMNGSGVPVESVRAIVGVTSDGQPTNDILPYNHESLTKGGGRQLPGQSQTFSGLYTVADIGDELVVEVRSPVDEYGPGAVFFRGTPGAEIQPAEAAQPAEAPRPARTPAAASAPDPAAAERDLTAEELEHYGVTP